MLFIPVAMSAVVTYFIFTHLVTHQNRIQTEGGLAKLAQVPHNLIVMITSTLGWPKRQFFLLLDGAWKEFLAQQHTGERWLFISIVVVLLVAFAFVLSKCSRTETEISRMRVWFSVLALTGLIILFLPTSIMALFRAKYESRYFYIPWMGAGILGGVALQAGLQLANRLRVTRLFSFLASVGIAVYVLFAAFIHLSVQDAFARGWANQQRLYAHIKTTLSRVDSNSSFYFVGDPRLIKTKMRIKQLSYQLIQLGYTISNQRGVKFPDSVDAKAVSLQALEDADARIVLQVVTEPWKGEVVRIESADVKAVDGLVLFGLEENQVVNYGSVRLP